MDDRVAKALLENNFLDRQRKTEADVALLQKLATNPSVVLMEIPNPAVTEPQIDCCVYHPEPQALGNNAILTSAPTGLAVHDSTTSVIYTPDIIVPAPVWAAMLEGLTDLQNATIQKLAICPNGAIYAACMFHPTIGNTFLAYAPYAGAEWTVLLDHAAMQTAVGSTDNVGLATLAVNPTEPEEIVYSIIFGGANIRSWIGNHAGFTPGVNATINLGSQFGEMSFSENGWLLTGDGYVLFSDDMSSILRSGGMVGPATRHVHAGITGDTIHWVSTASKIYLGTGDLTTITSDVGDTIIKTDAHHYEDFLVCDPTRQILMTMGNSGNPMISLDDGDTWNTISDLPGDIYWFTYIAGAGSSSKWAAVGASGTIFYSPDGGTTWEDRLGNLIADISPAPSFNALKVLPGISRPDCEEQPAPVEALILSISPSNLLAVHITGGLLPTLDGLVLSEKTDPDLDLTSHIPTSGFRYVGLQVNNLTGVWSVVDGAVLSLVDIAETSDLPVADSGNTLIFYVRLIAGIVRLCKSDLMPISAIPVDQTQLNTGIQIHAADEITVLIDDDEIGVWDSLTGLLAKITFANLVAQLTSIFNTLYAAIGHTHEETFIGHLHGIARWVADGSTTAFDLPDYAAYIESVSDNGSESDATIYSLSADSAQLIYDSAPTSTHIIQAHYVIASL